MIPAAPARTGSATVSMLVNRKRGHVPSVLRIVAYLTDDRHRTAIRRALYGIAIVTFFGSVSGVSDAIGDASADIIMIELNEQSGDVVLPSLRALRRLVPKIPIVAYVEHSNLGMDLLLRAGNIGITEVLLHGLDSDRTIVERVRRVVRDISLVALFRDEIAALPSRVVRSYLEYVFQYAAYDMTVESVCMNIRASRQHVADECKRIGLQSPRWLLTAARLLVAVQMAEDPTVTVGQLSHILHFASPRAFHNMVRRHAQAPFTVLCERGLHAEVFAMRKVLRGEEGNFTINTAQSDKT